MKNHTEENPEDYLPFQSFHGNRMESPMSSRIRLEFGAISHPGKIRENNEDAFLIYRTGRYWQKVNTNLPDGLLAEDYDEQAYTVAVADGMGGLYAGEIASRTVLTTIVDLVLSSVKWSLKLNEPETRKTEILEGIERGIGYLIEADAKLSQSARKQGVQRGMGTTLTGIYVHADDLFIFHVGDSRAYLYRSGQLNQITRDHTVAQELADAGVIPQSSVDHHHFKHLLTRAVGLHAGNVNVEIHHLKLLSGDSILLCTDGLSDMLDTNDITGVLNRNGKSQEKCCALLELALGKGGKDNITAVLAHYTIP
jgi:protein phosphatase